MHTPKKNTTKKIVLATFALVIFTLAFIAANSAVRAPFQRSRTISNAGSVVTIGVGIYWDRECTSRVSVIDWGALEPGSDRSVAVYIRNEGSSPAGLTMHTANWNPPDASKYVVLSWNREGYSAGIAEVIQATFTLSISADIAGITTFGFDIIITASTQ